MNLLSQQKYKELLLIANADKNLNIQELVSFICVTWKYCNLWSPANGRVAESKVYNMSKIKFKELIKDYYKLKDPN